MIGLQSSALAAKTGSGFGGARGACPESLQGRAMTLNSFVRRSHPTHPVVPLLKNIFFTKQTHPEKQKYPIESM